MDEGSLQLSLDSRRHVRGGPLDQMKVTGSRHTRQTANKYKTITFSPFKHSSYVEVVMSQRAFRLVGGHTPLGI